MKTSASEKRPVLEKPAPSFTHGDASLVFFSDKLVPQHISKRCAKRIVKCGSGDIFRHESISGADFRCQMVR
jgi:hypothetical protein